MGLFDSVISTAKERAGLGGDQAGGLIAALLGLITDPRGGGFGGFIDKFRNAGLGDIVDSWISTGDNRPLSGEQVESALGTDTIDSISSKSGVDRGTAAGALGGIIPGVVDSLTPDGTVPDEQTLLSRIGGFLSDWGGTIGGAVAGGVGAVSGAASSAGGKVSNMAGNVGNKVSGTVDRGVAVVERDSDGSIWKWLLPLLLLLALIVLGFWFCNRAPTSSNVAINANANRTNTNANRPATNSNANAVTSNANAASANSAAKTMTEVTLPNGTKLQAFAGGIEDQLVRFIQSDEYKKGTNDSLKDKWFNFDDLNFVFGKTELTPESKRQLDNIVAILKAFPDAKIKIGGYTDKKGDDAANLKLSDTRAKAVQAALQKAGVGAQVPEAEGYGEKFATVEETADDNARQVDRKTAVRLIK